MRRSDFSVKYSEEEQHHVRQCATSADAMTELFDFMGNKVRVVVITNETTGAKEPWFVATDVCRSLGMTNPTVAVAGLPKGECTKLSLGQRGLGAVLAVSESGLYKIVMRSNSPEAAKFQDWIARDVLPAIRKDGLSSPRWTFFTQG